MPYISLEQANSAIKGIKPPVTLEQANKIGYAADSMKKADADVESPMAVAIANWKKGYTVEGGKWVKKQSAEAGAKDDTSELAHEKGFTYAADNVHCTECGPKNGKVNPGDKKCPGCGKAFDTKTGEKELMYGVKAVTVDGQNLIILETMNAFMDREKEIFSTQAIADYVEFAENIGHKDRVRYWHMPGTDFASVVWQGMVGRFLTEVAVVDDTAYGRKMFDSLQNPQDYSDALPEGWGTSHGYLYRRRDRSGDGVYSKFVKFESTVLPAHRASNPYGKVGTKEKEVTMAGTKDDLVKLVGAELAEEVLKLTGEKSNDLEAEVDFKEKDNTGDDTDVGEKDDGEFYEFEVGDEFFAEVAKHVPHAGSKEVLAGVKEMLDTFRTEVLKSVAELMADSAGSKEHLLKEMLAGKITLRPYTATKDADNTVSVEVAEKAKNGRKKADPRDVDPVEYAVKHMVIGGMSGK